MKLALVFPTSENFWEILKLIFLVRVCQKARDNSWAQAIRRASPTEEYIICVALKEQFNLRGLEEIADWLVESAVKLITKDKVRIG